MEACSVGPVWGDPRGDKGCYDGWRSAGADGWRHALLDQCGATREGTKACRTALPSYV